MCCFARAFFPAPCLFLFCLFSVFKNLADGNITPEGYAVYGALRSHLLSLVPLPDTVVYLDATAQVRERV